MSLDARTLVVAAAVVNCVGAGLLLLLHRQDFPVPGTRLWALGSTLGATAAVLIVLRGIVPDALSIVLSNATLVLAYLVAWGGVAVFMGRRAHWGWIAGVPLTVMVPLAWFTYVIPSLNGRILIMAMALTSVCGITARELLTGPRPLRSPTTFTGGLFAVNTVVIVFRMAGVLVNQTVLPSLTSSVEIALYAWPMVFSVCMVAGFLLMTSERLHRELRQLASTIPICAHCKKIRSDQGSWDQLEWYLQTHVNLVFTRGVCPTCAREYHPDPA